ncbi:MAG: hypothetical protein RLP09_04335 [Sandaracinaceae bacterium]
MPEPDTITALRGEIERLRDELANLRAFVLPRELGGFRGAPGQPPRAWPADHSTPEHATPYELELIARARTLFRRAAAAAEAAAAEWKGELEGIRAACVERLTQLRGDAEALDSLRAFGAGEEIEREIHTMIRPPADASGAVVAIVEPVRRKGSGDALHARRETVRVG